MCCSASSLATAGLLVICDCCRSMHPCVTEYPACVMCTCKECGLDLCNVCHLSTIRRCRSYRRSKLGTRWTRYQYGRQTSRITWPTALMPSSAYRYSNSASSGFWIWILLLISRLHDRANIEQLSSKCIQNTRANCSTSARSCKQGIQLARRAVVISVLIRRAGGL